MATTKAKWARMEELNTIQHVIDCLLESHSLRDILGALRTATFETGQGKVNVGDRSAWGRAGRAISFAKEVADANDL